jgi:Gram-negative bacterial TonB protein C-terminal/PilZ domain
MAARAQGGRWTGPSRRRVPRFPMDGPLEVTVLRSGIPDTLPGRAVNVSERGMEAVLAGELKTGESVGVEVRLPSVSQPLRTRATVRYQDKLRYGLEFTAISTQQRNAIRDWAKGLGGEVKAKQDAASAPKTKTQFQSDRGRPVTKQSLVAPKRTRRVWLLASTLTVIAAAAGWWQWNRSWVRLESGLKNSQPTSVEKPQAQVPAEVMQKLLVHRVEPVYPAEARKQRLQGIIAMNVVVGRDGSVVSMHPLNGPDILAQAAMDSLRWWKFEPYRLNGEPAVVETTLAVEFKP